MHKDFLDFLKNPDYERFLYHESYRWVVRAQEYTKPPRYDPPHLELGWILTFLPTLSCLHAEKPELPFVSFETVMCSATSMFIYQ